MNYSILIRSLSHQYPLSLKDLYQNFNLHGKFDPSYDTPPSLHYWKPLKSGDNYQPQFMNIMLKLYCQHTFSFSYTARWIGWLRQFVPMFMLNILILNKLKREIVTRHTACSPQTTVVWWNSEEHSGCSLYQQKIMGLGFSTGAVSCTCGADRHLSTCWTAQNVRWHSKVIK